TAPNCSAVLIFGGDGTVHRHLPEVSKLKVPVLVVPSGSGNDFAKAMGLRNEAIALEAWKQFCAGGADVREVDLGLIRSLGEPGSQVDAEALFACVAGVGMDAEANARANRLPQWLKGHGGYLLAALRSLVAFKAVEMSAISDEKKIRQSAFFVAVGNAHRYGGGMKIAPRAAPDDGLLDVCFVSRMNKLKLLCWVPTIFFGGHLRLRQVEYFQARQLEIDAERPLQVYADGDYICRTPVAIRVISKALRVIVPARISL
ncbi:MAG TPA: diacylglycerol kinase family protein, partial [Candidatus Angelobacter sp.]|nr:diacylglycerol kinase family protein [Candidatus Angelobacter sp.]